MNAQLRVPIRVRRTAAGSHREIEENRPPLAEPEPVVVEKEPISTRATEPVTKPTSERETAPAQIERGDELQEEVEAWRDRALRLQAEIENFRKRQQRLAEDRVQADRVRLLRGFLAIADDLERALDAEGGDSESLRAGVEVTYRSLKQLLRQEGVERVEARGEIFDPTLHEAVATVPHHEASVDQDIVVEVAQQGYRLDGRLLRPARVVVAT